MENYLKIKGIKVLDRKSKISINGGTPGFGDECDSVNRCKYAPFVCVGGFCTYPDGPF